MNINTSLSQNFTPCLNTEKYSDNKSVSSENNSKLSKSSTNTKDSSPEKKIKTSKDDFTPYEQKIIEELKSRDQEVRDHEMAHVAAGGPYIKRGANYEYQKGPDGILYAIGGDVLIDTSPIPGNPEATIRKMDTVRSAALAPANPSGSDRAIASRASSTRIKASEELIKIQLEKSGLEKNDEKVPSEIAKTYLNHDDNSSKPGKFLNIAV
ncbi:MAG: putative metalloprotease CJM1_0395 family protein [Desulforegulaceae bacterium]|nr:putative metalloprotease CJM1_0395 family protein [Desulforegulaceae bacterium]